MRLADRLRLASDQALLSGGVLALAWNARGYRFLRWDAGAGAWWNVDPATGRILFGLPWAEYSHRQWGLVRSECDLMRLCVRHFRKIERGPFYFHKPSRRWYVDLVAWPTIDRVHASPNAWIITPGLVLAADNHRRRLFYDGR